MSDQPPVVLVLAIFYLALLWHDQPARPEADDQRTDVKQSTTREQGKLTQ